MKTLLLKTIFISAMLVPAFASATPSSILKFAKGSYCTSFSGDVSNGRIFNVSLGKNQKFTIDSESAGVEYIVNPVGKRINNFRNGYTSSEIVTTVKGNYKIFMSGEGIGSVKFCAY